MAECVDIEPTDLKGLADFAVNNQIDLTVVGPEAPLALGIVDEFTGRGLTIFGPDKGASELESSKIFSKKLMLDNNIPTGAAQFFDNIEDASEYIERMKTPIVVKADG